MKGRIRTAPIVGPGEARQIHSERIADHRQFGGMFSLHGVTGGWPSKLLPSVGGRPRDKVVVDVTTLVLTSYAGMILLALTEQHPLAIDIYNDESQQFEQYHELNDYQLATVLPGGPHVRLRRTTNYTTTVHLYPLGEDLDHGY